jgi:hypothetical protein
LLHFDSIFQALSLIFPAIKTNSDFGIKIGDALGDEISVVLHYGMMESFIPAS